MTAWLIGANQEAAAIFLAGLPLNADESRRPINFPSKDSLILKRTGVGLLVNFLFTLAISLHQLAKLTSCMIQPGSSLEEEL